MGTDDQRPQLIRMQLSRRAPAVRAPIHSAARARRGVALLWAIIAIVVLTLLASTAHQLASNGRTIGENYEGGQRALYFADQALSDYYSNFSAATDLNPVTVVSSLLDSTATPGDPKEAGATDSANANYDGADLASRDFVYDQATVRIVPTKADESRFGDVYLLEAQASVADPTGQRPPAERSLRTYAQLVPPLRIVAALAAPGGLVVSDLGKSSEPDHLHLDGKRHSNCGAATDVPPLATPIGTLPIDKLVKNFHLEPKDVVGWDSTALTYKQLTDSMHVDWNALIGDATYARLTNVVRIPQDYPTIAAIPFNSVYNRNAPWPIIRVTGDFSSNDSFQGFGLVIVEGSLTVNATMNFSGLILTGKGFNLLGDQTHLHLHGGMATGLNCTVTDLLTGACRVYMGPKAKHLGVQYQPCNFEAAFAQLMRLRPLTPSRHVSLH